MGIKDLIGGIFSKKKEKSEEKKEVSKETPEIKSSNICALCQKPGADKKWAGQYWHKKCLRMARKTAQRMV